jgi:hypothetical protein
MKFAGTTSPGNNHRLDLHACASRQTRPSETFAQKGSAGVASRTSPALPV